MSTGTKENRDGIQPPEWCGQCDRKTRHMNTPDGPKRCACHWEGELLRQHRICSRCLSVVYKWDRNPCESHDAIRSAPLMNPAVITRIAYVAVAFAVIVGIAWLAANASITATP